jgi:hypothetical protein
MRINAWAHSPSPPPSPGNAYRAKCVTATSYKAVDAPSQEMAQEFLGMYGRGVGILPPV